jgi:hypothetical protein
VTSPLPALVTLHVFAVTSQLVHPAGHPLLPPTTQ